MNILQEIDSHGKRDGNAIALQYKDELMTYEELDAYSGKLAQYIQAQCGDNKAPVVVYGHKNPYMIVCFLAAVKSGRAYCPLDISMPLTRVEETIEIVQPSITFVLEEVENNWNAVTLEETKQAISNTEGPIESCCHLRSDEVFYIIFTSGSTGTPKGVQITMDCLNHYLDWSADLGTPREDKREKVFLNQAPFSFDLSVKDFYTGLACGGTIYLLDKETQLDLKSLFAALKHSDTAIWVSTPSFADMCLIDKQFSSVCLPKIEVFLFCGETLNNSTALKLMSRFPDAKIVNTYGPTESTVAVTEIAVTRDLAELPKPLPVGKIKPGSFLEIHRADGSIASTGESGEIVIVGDTVSTGYFKAPHLTQKSFFTQVKNGREHRAYRTGDKGYLDEAGNLHYQGRIDLQIKLNGYRIELEDIEKNLLKLHNISHAAVIPSVKEGKVKSLTAFVVGQTPAEQGFKFSKKIKNQLKEFLPSYMIPKKIVPMESLPMNHNGKVDRKQLGGLA